MFKRREIFDIYMILNIIDNIVSKSYANLS